MLHGNPSWSFYYRDLIKSLRGEYRAIAPDHIGCGYSDKPGEDRYPYILERRVADFAHLMDQLELQRVTLIVHDWGGMIGMAWAAAHPRRIARLVILNTAAFPLPADKKFPFALKLARTPGLGTLLIRGFNAFSRGANRFCAKRMADEVARGYLLPYDSWKNRIAVHRFVTDIPLSPRDRSYRLVSETAARLHELRGLPMLICWGMRDFVFDRCFLDEWARRFPDAEIHRFEDAGHYVLEDAGNRITALIQQFLHRGINS
ncbi:MAG: alpha/beta fold hydrolase [Gammaproteobacteria bacterium]|nr:alpha/beta fold hydrolase [Gammaproteobacteria bacterium]